MLTKKVVKVEWDSNDPLYVYWEYDDGVREGAYNLMYETELGLSTLYDIMKREILADIN